MLHFDQTIKINRGNPFKQEKQKLGAEPVNYKFTLKSESLFKQNSACYIIQ